MPIDVVCPSCNRQTKAKNEHIGKKARCKCGHVFLVEPIAQRDALIDPEPIPSNEFPAAVVKPQRVQDPKPDPEPKTKGFWASIKDAADNAAERSSREFQVVYVSGPYDLKPKNPGTLALEDSFLILKSAILKREHFRIPYKSIISANVDTAERMTALRVIALGVFAFGFKKKDKFLNLTFFDETELEVSVIFGKASMGPQMETLGGKIMTKRRESLVGATTIDDVNESASPQSTHDEECDIAGQLQKLANLHDKNLITDDEFCAKKKEILSKL